MNAVLNTVAVLAEVGAMNLFWFIGRAFVLGASLGWRLPANEAKRELARRIQEGEL
jgi:hypothetical protein